MHLYHSMFDFENIPAALVFNARPEACSLTLPWNRRNGRILLQGSLLRGKTFVEYLPRARNSDIWIDAIGQTHGHPETVQILKNAEADEKRHYRFLGFMSSNKLSEIRNSYAYALVMWNPETFDGLHACPNKFFEAVADAVPPICAPHPQCKEIVERFDCGIPMKDWSYESFAKALQYAQDIYGTERYRQLVENCRVAQHEICWENQFNKVASLLPPPSISKTRRKPKFLLIDPTLQTEIGHHLTYAETVLQPARAAGFQTVAAINRNFHVRLCGADRLQPLFRYDFWGRDISIEEKPRIPDSSKHFIETIRRLTDQERLSSRDHVFVPNISDSDLRELADFLACTKPLMQSTWHIILRHDLPTDPMARVAAVARLSKISAPRVHFYTDTKELSQQHEDATGVAFRTLPIPVLPDFHPSETPLSPYGLPLKVAYLGDARWEKGFCEIPRIVESSLDLIISGKLRFSIQCNTPGPERECKDAILRLRELSANYPVELLTNRLSKQDYDTSLHAADIILALYDRQSYARRSSHVVMEALTHGKAVIVTSGTSSAALLPKNCPWRIQNSREAAERLRWIAEYPEKSRKLSRRLQAVYAHSQTGSRLLEELMDSADADGSVRFPALAAASS
jgi:glycosyltransferase involved in cell wall biosynthesis